MKSCSEVVALEVEETAHPSVKFKVLEPQAQDPVLAPKAGSAFGWLKQKANKIWKAIASPSVESAAHYNRIVTHVDERYRSNPFSIR